MIKRLLLWPFLAFTFMFLVPLGGAAAWWSVQDRPSSWRSADWGPSGHLPAAEDVDGAAIYVLAARTGGLKGAASVHSWIVWKDAADQRWTRAEVVGWGRPVRVNAYAPDARWYSNDPFTVGKVTGDTAAALIPRISDVVASYPNDRGSYEIWPGPNSNTFVAHILREVPELGMTLPPNAVGKDWIGDGAVAMRDDGGDVHLSLWGYAGLSFGPRTGLELNILGQTFGFDIAKPALKLPAVGRVGMQS